LYWLCPLPLALQRAKEHHGACHSNQYANIATITCLLPLQITGGRNGYGAKLANIFSTKFSVETCDGKRQRRFLQTFTSNMSSKSEPKITACKATDNWTCITFQPDLAKFDMQVGGGAYAAMHSDRNCSAGQQQQLRCRPTCLSDGGWEGSPAVVCSAVIVVLFLSSNAKESSTCCSSMMCAELCMGCAMLYCAAAGAGG
jgi:hypothetical protein